MKPSLKERLKKEHELYLRAHRDSLRLSSRNMELRDLLQEIRDLMGHCHSWQCKNSSFPEGNDNCVGCIVVKKIKAITHDRDAKTKS